MIFLTAGTQFAFDRLVRAIDRSVAARLVPADIFAQIGESSYTPANFEFARFLSKDDFDRMFTNADAIISHAGMGTISMALECEKPMLAMPRLKQFHEVVNDHQVSIARRFARDGYILAAFDENQLQEKLPMLPSFVPRRRLSRAQDVAARIADFLCSLEGTR